MDQVEADNYYLKPLLPIQRDLMAFYREHNPEIRQFLAGSPRGQLHFLNVATLQEVAELRDESGWKWWKRSFKHDRANFQVELADILHFSLQELITLPIFMGTFPNVTNPEEDIVDYCRKLVNNVDDLQYCKASTITLNQLPKSFEYLFINQYCTILNDLCNTQLKLLSQAVPDFLRLSANILHKIDTVFLCGEKYDVGRAEIVNTYRKKVEENKQRQLNHY